MFATIRKRTEHTRSVHRKGRRTAAVLAVLMVLTFCMSGCGLFAPSAVSLAKAAAENVQKAQSAEINAQIQSGVSLTYDALNFSLDLDLDADIDTEMTREPQRSKGTVGLEFDLFGGRQSLQGQYYTDAPGDETKVTYLKLFGDFWTKQTKQVKQSGQSEVSPLVLGMGLLKYMQDKTLTAELHEEMAEVNGKEAYQITCGVKGVVLKDLLTASRKDEEPLPFDPEKVNWDNIEVPAEIYIYKDTKLPARIVMEADSIASEIITPMFSEAIKKNTDNNAIASGIGLKVNTCRIDMTIDRYDEIEEITIPEEVTNAKESGDFLQQFLQMIGIG